MDTENQTLRFLKNTLDQGVKEGDHGRIQHTIDLIKKEMAAMELKMAKDDQRAKDVQRAKDALRSNIPSFVHRPVATMHRVRGLRNRLPNPSDLSKANGYPKQPRDFTNKSDEYVKRAQEQAARQHIIREMCLNGLKTLGERTTSRDDHSPGEFLANLKEEVKELRRHHDLIVDVVKDQERHKREALQDRIRAFKNSSEAGRTVIEPATKVAEPTTAVADTDMSAQASAARHGATLEELAEIESEIDIETPAESEANSSMGWRTDHEVEEDKVAWGQIFGEVKEKTEEVDTVAKVAEEPTDRLETCVKELEKLLKEEREHFRDMTAYYAGAEMKAANAENRVKELEEKLEDLGEIHFNSWNKLNEELKESIQLEEELNERLAVTEKRARDAEEKAQIAEKRIEELEELATDVESNFNPRFDFGAEDCEEEYDGGWGDAPRGERASTHGDGAGTRGWGTANETAENRLNNDGRNKAGFSSGHDYHNLAMAQQGVATAEARLAEAESRVRKNGEGFQRAWGSTSVIDPFGYPHGWVPQMVPARVSTETRRGSLC